MDRKELATPAAMGVAFVPATHRHPGTPEPDRQIAVEGYCPVHWRRVVPSGQDLLETLLAWARGHQATSALFRVVGGIVDSLSVMTGRPDPGGVATFHGPHEVDCPAQFLSCHGIIGVGPSGLVVHAHAIFLDRLGVGRGCHLIAGRCIAAGSGLIVDFAPLTGAAFQLKHDPESRFNLLFPIPTRDSPLPGRA